MTAEQGGNVVGPIATAINRTKGCGRITRGKKMAIARIKPTQWLLLTVLAMGFTQVFAQDWPAEPPAEAPADWGPVSLNLEEIEYPWPVQYLELRRYGQKMLMAGVSWGCVNRTIAQSGSGGAFFFQNSR